MFYIYNSNGNFNKLLKTLKIILSILLILGGILCIINPLGTVATVEMIAGIFILATGLFRGFEYFSLAKDGIKNPSLITGCILNIVLGLVFLVLPSGFTVSFITGVISFVLLIVGVVKIISAVKAREYNSPGWQSGLVVGILALAIAITFMALPLATDILVVVILGVYLLFNGISLLFSGHR